MRNFAPAAAPVLALLCVLLCACTNTKKIAYFNNQADTTLSVAALPQSVIQKNDILGISVSSLNPQASSIFNNQQVSYNTNSEMTPASQPAGYLVNAQGNIQFPVIGSVKAAGLTTTDLSREIQDILLQRKLLVDPIVTIRYLNFKVTVLGEVARPTVINVQNEKITLLEALGLAGDLTIYGKRDNVMLIREQEGKKVIRHLDLNSSNLLTSQYYQLQSNDVIYVEPNKAKASSATRTSQVLPLLLSGLSFAAIIIDRLVR